MKKNELLCIGSLCLLLLLAGCKTRRPAQGGPAVAPDPSAETTEAVVVTAAPASVPSAEAELPTAAPRQEAPETPEERIVARCISVRDELPYAADLDGDGRKETVDLAPWVSADEYPRWELILTKDGAQKRFETDISCDMPYDLWTGDLDEDGQYELFFHGDLASDDYIIYAFRSDLSLLFFDPDDRFLRWNENEGESNVFAGRIEGFDDNQLIVGGYVDMLGTHWGIRSLIIGDDGVIGPFSTVWQFDEDWDRALLVTKALTAYAAGVRKDPGEAFTLEPGERIRVLASDGCERMWFETGSGKHGVLLLTPDEDTLILWRIDGAPETDYFEFLPYSG